MSVAAALLALLPERAETQQGRYQRKKPKKGLLKKSSYPPSLKGTKNCVCSNIRGFIFDHPLAGFQTAFIGDHKYSQAPRRWTEL